MFGLQDTLADYKATLINYNEDENIKTTNNDDDNVFNFKVKKLSSKYDDDNISQNKKENDNLDKELDDI